MPHAMSEPLSFPYHHYMLRFWPEPQENGAAAWRYTLIDPHSGQRHSFLSLDSLIAYLSVLTEDLAAYHVQPKR